VNLHSAAAGDRVCTRDRYLIKSVVHAARVLSTFDGGEALTLAIVKQRSGLARTLVFRMLYTLERCGYVEKPARNLYRLRSPGFAWRRRIPARTPMKEL
jgi:DNA-binding IclR family transcriptional regulator